MMRPATVEKIKRAATMQVEGLTFCEIGERIGLSPHRVENMRWQHRELWQSFQPKGFTARRGTPPGTVVPSRPRPNTAELVPIAAELSARRTPRREIAKRLNVSITAIAAWQRDYRDLWEPAFDAEMERIVAEIKAAAGSESAPIDPEQYLAIVREAEKWSTAKGKHLLPPKPPEKQAAAPEQLNGEMPTLAAYLEQVYLPARPDVSEGYGMMMRLACQRLQEHAGRVLRINEVEPGMIGTWMTAGLENGLRPGTVNGRRRMMRSILLAAYDDGFLTVPPRKVRRVRENLQPPEAWTIEEFNRILAVAGGLQSEIDGIPAGKWWVSLLLAVYYTGCRIGALMSARVEDYRPGCGLTIRRQKNGKGQWYSLPEDACAAIEAILGEREAVWPWPFHKGYLWKQFRAIVELSRVRYRAKHGDLFHRLRRTNLSYLAAVDPELAQRQADHSDLRTTRDSYIDPRIAPGRATGDILPRPTWGGADQ